MWDWVPKPKKHTDHLPNACLELVKVLNHLLLLSNHRFVNIKNGTNIFVLFLFSSLEHLYWCIILKF